MIETIIGWGLGGLLRLIPEWFKNSRETKQLSHDEKMLDKQIALERIRGSSQTVVSNNDKEIAKVGALTEAIKGQSNLTGTWVDGLSASVRPIITYLIVALYCAAKISAMVSPSIRIWFPEDTAHLDAVMSFWFVDRVMRR